MDLKSGYPFWPIKNGLLHAFPPLQRDLSCDVAVLGAGISGALIADELARHGHDVAVLDERDAGWGSTAASTALLQYEIDTPMTELAQRLGEDAAAASYLACAAAIGRLGEIARDVGGSDFVRMDSLYYASKPAHAHDLAAEYALRRKHGLPVAWLDEGGIAERFGFDAPAAILSRCGAQVDPYRLAYRLLMRLERKGVGVHDRTGIARIVPGARGVQLHTADGATVRAKHVVLATGYAAQRWLKQRVARNRSSYALVTEPIEAAALGRLRKTLVWETARPYLYMRTTADGRLMLGGEDDAVDIPAKRDARLAKKSARLLEKLAALFPRLPLQKGFDWAGTFAETEDGLPFFGPHPQHGPRVHFAMAYGGNGITYSAIGAELLRAGIERRAHPLAELFSFRRLDR